MCCLWIFDELLVRRGELVVEPLHTGIVDDPVATSEHHQSRKTDLRSRISNVMIEGHIGQGEANRDSPQGHWIGANVVLPGRYLGKQRRVLQRNCHAPLLETDAACKSQQPPLEKIGFR